MQELESNEYTGTTDERALRGRLGSVTQRLGMSAPGAAKLRPFGARGAELTLSFADAAPVVRRCESQRVRAANVGALVQWVEDLARNAERGIETIGEALAGDGMSLVVRGAAPPTRELARNDYAGALTPDESWELVERAIGRLRLDPWSVWMGRDGDAVVLRIQLDDSRRIEKRSALQRDARRNAAALALWLRGRARHHERGIERDLVRSFAAYLVDGRTG